MPGVVTESSLDFDLPVWEPKVGPHGRWPSDLYPDVRRCKRTGKFKVVVGTAPERFDIRTLDIEFDTVEAAIAYIELAGIETRTY